MKAIFLTIFAITTSAWAEQPPIPLPGDLFYPGYIKVIDPLNNSHARGVSVCFVKLDTKLNYMGNIADDCTDHAIGEEIHLPSGKYFLKLIPQEITKDSISQVQNFSSTLAEVAGGKSTEIELVSRVVEKSHGDFKIRLYRDLNNPIERDQFLARQWALGNRQVQRFFAQPGYYCHQKKLTSEEAAACQAFKAKDYKSLLGAFKFGKDGTYRAIEIAFTPDYRESQDPTTMSGNAHWLRDGEAIALFPGYYVAEFTNSVGKVSYDFNIDFTRP